MQVLPHAFDAIRVRTVGRQEVQHDPPVERFEMSLCELCAMNAVVVDDQVDPISFRIPDNEQVQHLAEQRRVFVVGTRDVQLSGPSVQRTRQVELLVLAG